jgi:poly-D-alanine transfer protein DltD
MKWLKPLPLLMLLATPVWANNTPAIVFGYECRQINAEETGFSCSMERGMMQLHLTKDPAGMSPEQRDYMEYRYHALIVRYISLGGNRFNVTSKYWPQKARIECNRPKQFKMPYSYSCEVNNAEEAKKKP